MSNGSTATTAEILRAEHDGVNNTPLKKVGNYGWDTDSMSWKKLSTNADGELKINLETADIEIGAVELKDGTSDERAPISATNGVLVNLGANNDMVSGIGVPTYDYVALTVATLTNTYVFKTGGVGGTTVATVVLTYTDSTKATLSTAART